MMRILLKILKMRKNGSIILELAVVAPVLILIQAFLLTAISCARADIFLSQAVDQVTQEVSLAIPIAGAGIDLAGDALALINKNVSVSGDGSSAAGKDGMEKTGESAVSGLLSDTSGGVAAIFDAFGIEAEDVIGTLLFGETIRDRIISTFSSYCQSDALLFARIDNASVFADYDKEKNVIWLRVYYEWKTLFGPAERQIVSAVPIFGDLDLPTSDEKEESAADKVWLTGNFERGAAIRSICGANLPYSYPVIAKWEGGTATSIKSIDLTAPEYQTVGPLTEKIICHIDDLAAFSGTAEPWGKDHVTINRDLIVNRVLLIVVPENSPPKVYNELVSCSAFGASCGVSVIIKKYGVSLKYEQGKCSPGQTG